MEKTNFKISPNITQEQLMDYGFHHVYPSQYVYRVPCYKYKKQPLIFLEFTVIFEVNSKHEFHNPAIVINCKDRNDNPYTPFYRNEYFAKNEVLEKVNKKLILVVSDMIKKEIIIKDNRIKNKRRRSK